MHMGDFCIEFQWNSQLDFQLFSLVFRLVENERICNFLDSMPLNGVYKVHQDLKSLWLVPFQKFLKPFCLSSCHNHKAARIPLSIKWHNLCVRLELFKPPLWANKRKTAFLLSWLLWISEVNMNLNDPEVEWAKEIVPGVNLFILWRNYFKWKFNCCWGRLFSPTLPRFMAVMYHFHEPRCVFQQI